MNAMNRCRQLLAIALCIFAPWTVRPKRATFKCVFSASPRGLSHQTVNCFCQDEFGFVWIGTQDGLNRFDGRTVDRFQLDGTPGSISSNNIRQLYSDRNGHIFIRSLQCVERYDLRLERFDLLYNGDVSAMACIGGEIYLSTTNASCASTARFPPASSRSPKRCFRSPTSASIRGASTTSSLRATG